MQLIMTPPMAIEQLKCNYGRFHSSDSANKTFRIYLIKLIEVFQLWFEMDAIPNGMRHPKWKSLCCAGQVLFFFLLQIAFTKINWSEKNMKGKLKTFQNTNKTDQSNWMGNKILIKMNMICFVLTINWTLSIKNEQSLLYVRAALCPHFLVIITIRHIHVNSMEQQ